MHGHTPVHRPRISKFEIVLDSGAGSNRPLTTRDVRSDMTWYGRYNKGRLSTTSIGCLPGVFCATFANDTVVFYCKGEPTYTLLFYYQHVPDDPEVPQGHFRDLACLQFYFVVNDPAEAQALALASWDQYQEQILTGNGGRMYVTNLESGDRRV